nr:MAG: chaperone of endosialidase [Bacteriophage sp.]
MYVSKYYTCEEIDQRLLQGYYDDSLAHGFVGTLKEFWAFFLSIANKVDKKEGWDLSENNFSDELLEKLNGIEEHANYVTKVSQLENDLKYQTQEQVEKYIHDLVDGADDALDTLKELAEALNNDPNFATNITNRLTELRTQLEAEVTRAKNRENELASQIKIVNDNLVNSVNTLNATIIKVVQDITRMIEAINARIQKVEDRVGDLEVETDNNLTEAKEYAKELVDKEAAERRAADEKLTEAVHKVQLDHTRDIADLNNKILTEASERANADVALESKLNTEISDRKTADQELESKINAEAAARTAQDEVLHQQIVKETSDRQNADNGLQQNITQEAQNRQNADTVLQNNIDNEKETRIAQDEILDHKIEDLKTQAGTDKTELLEKLEQEKQERIAADKDLDNRKVDKREGYSLTKNDFTDILKAKLDGIEEHANYITKVSQLINDAGYQTEADLQAAIEKIIGEAPEVLDTLKEIADALGNDPNFATTITKKLAAITEQLNQEITNRTEADAQVQANVDKEVSDRKEADTALEAKLKEYVDNEVDKITGNTDGIQASLNKEIQDRKDADAALQAAITKEETDRKAGDAALDTRVTANATKIQELALSIQDAVNTVKNELQAKIDALQTEVNANKANIQRNTDRLNDQITKEAEDYDELKGMVNAEAEARANADTNLKSQVDKVNIDLNTEVSKREAGDTVLQQNIDKEISDRTSSDTLLDNKFTGLINTESTARVNEDEKINARIDQEIKDRKAGDDALSTRIDSLNSGVTGSLDELREKVTNNTTAIQTEVERSKAAEQALKDSLTTALENHKDDLVAINKDLTNEAKNRLMEDTKLQNNIDNEVLNRTQADTLLENKIAQEISDRVQAIENLNKRKVDKVDGKELSSNDFTDLLKAKLDNIQEFANYITKVSQLANDLNYQTAEQVAASLEALKGAAPVTLDTLEEIANAIKNDPLFADHLDTTLKEIKDSITTETNERIAGDKALADSKVDKVVGKDLSTNDFDDTLKAKLDGIEEHANYITKLSELANDTNYQNAEQVAKAIQDVIGSAPGVLDTLEEIAKALGDDPNFATTITTKLDELKAAITKEETDRKAAIQDLDNRKVEKEAGKGLSTNDFTNELKSKLDNIEEGAKNITKVSQLENDSKYQTDKDLAKAISDLKGNAPTTLDTLEEVALALNNDPNYVLNLKTAQDTLNSDLQKEISNREAADKDIKTSFDTLSINTDKKIEGITTSVSETRKELLDKAAAQDGLITQNAANIQRNLELIQGLQSNQNTGYLEIKELLNTEIEARKAEDIRIEAKVDKNTQDLTTERNERIAADKVLQDNIDAEEAARIAADNALGKRIDKEIEDRKAADTALENKFNGITNGLDERLQKEEATSNALPLTMVTEIDPNLVINGTSAEVNFKSSVKGEGNLYGESMPRKFAIPASTDAKAGLQSAADKKRWNSMPNDYITGASYTPKAGVVTTNISRSTYNSDEGIQKSNNFTVDIPASTAEKAGVQTAADKKLFNSIPQTVVVGEGATSDANKVTVSVNRKTVNEGIYKDDNTTFNLPVASTTKAGTMSAADKVKLDETLPQQIAKEIQDRKDAIEALKNSSEASLAQEIKDRKAADQALDTKFTQAIKEEADARAEYDRVQMQKIQEEEEARAAADTALENKLQTNINNLEKKHDDFVATKGKANGLASLDGNGLVPSSQLPSYVDDVIEVYATYDVSETGKLSNIKLYSDPDHANPITGESGKIYLNITQDEPSYQFRWSGTQFVDSNTSSLILGEVTGTAYDGGKGKALADWRKSLSDNLKFYSHIKDDRAWTRNATEVRLNFDCSDFGNTASVNTHNQPIPAATKDLAGVQTAADKKLFDSIPGTIIISGKGVVQNTDKVWVQISKSTKADGVYGEATTQTLEILAANANRAGVLTREMFNKLNSGLNGDITNALNEAKAYTDAAKTALEKLIQDSDKVIKESLDAHIGNKSNPHNVTKAQVGLGNVQNLAPADMPVSTAQAAAIADAKAAGTKAQTDLNTHANRKDNPHNVTRAQLGLATTDQVVFAKTTAASGFWKESDGRLKSQVENLNHTLDQICNIPTVHFKMNGKYQVGTIAQSLEEIEPLLVSENTIPASQVPNQSRFETFVGEDGQEYVKIKVVEYEMLSVMALEGVKLLRKEFEDFKKQLNNK